MSTSSHELQRIVHINEQIKRVVRTAFRISIMALNAIMLSRRSGDAARGFGVLSDELRRFSADLSQQMAGLRSLTAELVGTVSALVKEARYLAIVERINVQNPAIDALIESVRQRQREAVNARAEALRGTQIRLRDLTDGLLPLIQLGTVLARSAHIEAVYGGEYAQDLTQVSDAFSRTVREIETALAALHKATGAHEG